MDDHDGEVAMRRFLYALFCLFFVVFLSPFDPSGLFQVGAETATRPERVITQTESCCGRELEWLDSLISMSEELGAASALFDDDSTSESPTTMSSRPPFRCRLSDLLRAGVLTGVLSDLLGGLRCGGLFVVCQRRIARHVVRRGFGADRTREPGEAPETVSHLWLFSGRSRACSVTRSVLKRGRVLSESRRESPEVLIA